MAKFGLIGNPISHSLSPTLFRAGYYDKYSYDLIEGSDFSVSFQKFLDEYDGVNVTAPFKIEAFNVADIFSDECKAIGAANILVKTAQGVKACNSDFLGVRQWLSETAGCRMPNVLIAGCGGAGKAAAMASLSLGFKTTVMNRDRAKAESLADSWRTRCKITAKEDIQISVADIDKLADLLNFGDILIYCIPEPINSLARLKDCDFRKRTQPLHILEANYRNPSFCGALSDLIGQSDGKVIYTSGKTWLLYQAMTGYEIFTGEIPDLGKMSACL